MGSTKFYLKHALSGRFLFTSQSYNYNENNCGHRCPIMGQLEISCTYNKFNENLWRFSGGLFFKFEEPKEASDEYEDRREDRVHTD